MEKKYGREIRHVFVGELYMDKPDFMTKLVLRVVKGIKEGYSRLPEAKIDRLIKVILG